MVYNIQAVGASNRGVSGWTNQQKRPAQEGWSEEREPEAATAFFLGAFTTNSFFICTPLFRFFSGSTSPARDSSPGRAEEQRRCSAWQPSPERSPPVRLPGQSRSVPTRRRFSRRRSEGSRRGIPPVLHKSRRRPPGCRGDPRCAREAARAGAA